MMNMNVRTPSRVVLALIAIIFALIDPCLSFTLIRSKAPNESHIITAAHQIARGRRRVEPLVVDDEPPSNLRRRDFLLLSPLSFAAAFLICGRSAAPAFAATAASLSDNNNVLKLLEQSRRQLDAVPVLIDSQKWDSVRAILITPPLSDCWTKSTNMLRVFAESCNDELAALEAREEVVSHLRFLDMAVYNNVFNPIATEGTSGATKELVRSYYEDPINEWKASVAALDELIQLGKSH